MKFETHLNIGDRAYVVHNCAIPEIERMTVGEVSLRYNKKEGLEERYMCKETGIGTGNVYTYGKTSSPQRKRLTSGSKSFWKNMLTLLLNVSVTRKKSVSG